MKTRKLDIEVKGRVTKKDFEVPEGWSDRAALIVAKTYAMDYENSAVDIIDRVVNQIGEWGWAYGYFDNTYEIQHDKAFNKFKKDLRDILINQRAAFNSPVWFNVGVPENCNQCSACFVLPIEDNMDSILGHYSIEGNIFKGGSGAGMNISKLRAKGEKLSNKGESSGPVVFMRGFDKSAGAIRSGGKNRRSAKLVCLDMDHPDIEEFIECKTLEENKAKILVDNGVGYDEAYSTVDFQNTNHSIRVNDEFMRCVTRNHNIAIGTKSYEGDHELINRGDGEVAKTIDARDLLMKAAENTWITGDPGIQYDDRMNLDNPVPSVDKIRSTNPCFAGETLLHTRQGLKRIESLVDRDFYILCHDGKFRVAKAFPNGRKKIYKVTLSSGNELLCTENHRLLESRKNMKFVEARDINSKVELGFVQKGNPFGLSAGLNSSCYHGIILLGYATGDGTPKRIQDKKIYGVHNARIYLRKDGDDNEVGNLFKSTFTDWKEPKDEKKSLSSKEFTLLWDECNPEQFVTDRFIPQEILEGNVFVLGTFLKGLFSANGSVQPKYNRVSLKTTSKRLAIEVINSLSILGIHSYMTTNKKKLQKFSNGIYEMKESYDVNVSKKNNLKKFMSIVSFVQTSKINKLIDAIEKSPESVSYLRRPSIKSIEFVREDTVYDFTEQETHTGVANGIVVHNCSEFSAVDNSSCNLSSLNLLAYWDGIEFNWDQFDKDIKVLITAMDILIDAADYPTEDIRDITVATRPLGLGFSNLGALLMIRGVPYDSDEGRSIAAEITKHMTTTAYYESVELAKEMGSFELFDVNRQTNLDIATRLIGDGSVISSMYKYGLRNSQLTLLAPTGSISFMMDCDTTGIEPLFAIKSEKTLVGGEKMILIPDCVKEAGNNLRAVTGSVVTDDQIIESKEYKDIFATANEISWKGHVDMMAACQPYLSGAISKTVNMSPDCTAQDIFDVYVYGWEVGLKAVAVYKDGSKGNQPITDISKRTEDSEAIKVLCEILDETELKSTLNVTPPYRMKLSDERKSITHKFSITGHEGYLTVGLYGDGSPGEMFIRMHKEGSNVAGMMDSFAISISLMLQYGIPLVHMVDKFKDTKFEPQGITQNPDIQFAGSILDYIFRWMELKFLKEDEYNEVLSDEKEELIVAAKEIAIKDPSRVLSDVCSHCGGRMIRQGNCSLCFTCGLSNGCS